MFADFTFQESLSSQPDHLSSTEVKLSLLDGLSDRLWSPTHLILQWQLLEVSFSLSHRLHRLYFKEGSTPELPLLFPSPAWSFRLTLSSEEPFLRSSLFFVRTNSPLTATIMSTEHNEKDLENGDAKRERISFADGWDPDKDDGEYANLIRYISTYRDRRFSKAPSQASDQDGKEESGEKKKPGFFGRLLGRGGGPQQLYEVPEEWLDTDIKKGLTSAEVEERRRKTGFNELTTEKENMLVKFIGYFRGPILYGEQPHFSHTLLPLLTRHFSHGTRCSARCRSSGLDRLRCHHRYPDVERYCRLVPGKASCRRRRQFER